MNLNRDYGTKLELLRTKAKIPQKGVAIALGVSQEYYSSLERNEGNFKFEYVEKLADLYKMSALDVAQFLWSDDKTIIFQTTETNNGALTAQGSVVQNQGIDDQKLKCKKSMRIYCRKSKFWKSKILYKGFIYSSFFGASNKT